MAISLRHEAGRRELASAAYLSLGLSEYSLEIRFLQPGRYPLHVGTTLRGGLGKALREISCVYPGVSCAECSLGSRCAYGYLFETPTGTKPRMMRRYSYSPHPFVLLPPSEDMTEVQEGYAVHLRLTTIGTAGEYFPHFLMGFRHLGELGLGQQRVKFRLERITHLQSGVCIYRQGQTQAVIPPEPTRVTAEVGTPSHGRFTLRYVSPLRLRVNDRILTKPGFGPLVSAALRRLKLLCHVHDTGQFHVDAPDLARRAQDVRLVDDATSWRDQRRFSRRQEASMPLGGLVGAATFEGDIGTFRDILRLAGRVHVGKGTAFGHGHFVLEEATTYG